MGYMYEGGNGYNFYNAYLWIKNRERNKMNRPVNYERALWKWNTDMYVPQYPSAAWFEEIGEKGADRPVDTLLRAEQDKSVRPVPAG